MSDELREKVARDDATYMAMKRKIMSLIVDTWDGERLIENAADAAIALVRDATLEEAARKVPTTWLDPLLTGPGATEPPLDGPGVEKLCRGIAAAIRAMKGQTTT